MRITCLVLCALAVALNGCSDSSNAESSPPTDAGGNGDAKDSGATSDSGVAGGGAGGTGGQDASADGNQAGSSGSGGSSADAGDDGGGADASADGGEADAGCPPAGIPGADSDGDGTNDENDCLPCDPLVHPNVTAWHTKPRSDGSWDWNCDGNEEKQYGLGKCVYPGCTKKQGFYKVPACGGKGQLISYCITNKYSCGTQWASSGSTTQGCR